MKKDESTNGKVEEQFMRIKEHKIYWNLKSVAFAKFLGLKKGPHLNQREFEKFISDTGHEEKIKTLLENYLISQQGLKDQKENYDFITESKEQWSEFVMNQYIYLSKNYYELSGESKDDIPFIYDDNKFLSYLSRTRNYKDNFSSQQLKEHCVIKLRFKSPSIKDIQMKYDGFFSWNLGYAEGSGLIKEKEKIAKTLLENDPFKTELDNFFKQGIPTGFRVSLYLKYFEIDHKDKAFEVLEEKLENEELPEVLLNILETDSAEVLNDNRYFVFKEILQRILPVFFKDKNVKLQLMSHPFCNYIFDKYSTKYSPPSGILPCKYFSKYLAPFCYTSQNVNVIYQIFFQFYCQYFCFLNSISSNPNSILSLCVLFEELMLERLEMATHHMKSLNVEPLHIAFPWLFHCFIGYIDVDQLFYLFDRILGYRSLEVVVLFAVSIFCKYQSEILSSQDEEELKLVFSDLIDECFLENMLLLLEWRNEKDVN